VEGGARWGGARWAAFLQTPNSSGVERTWLEPKLLTKADTDPPTKQWVEMFNGTSPPVSDWRDPKEPKLAVRQTWLGLGPYHLGNWLSASVVRFPHL
jgi:hypothetical protein